MKFAKQEIIFATVMLALIVASWVTVFGPAQHKRAALLADLKQKKTALDNLAAATAGIDDMNHKLSELQKAITFFEAKLPQEKEIDQVLKEVWQLAQANSLQCKTIKTLKPERDAAYSEQPIELSLSGNFEGYYSFLLQLEKLPRITRTMKMDLEKINGREGEMTAKMTMSIFFEPANNGQSPVASAQ